MHQRACLHLLLLHYTISLSLADHITTQHTQIYPLFPLLKIYKFIFHLSLRLGTLPAPAIFKPRPLWTGKQLFSMVCPDINYLGKSKNHPKKKDELDFNQFDSEVLIHSGELLMGIVDKNIVGTSGGSIVHVTWLSKGWEETRAFMNQIQTVVNYWMVNTSYTVSISDTVANKDTMDKIQGTLDTAKQQVKDLFSRGIQGKIKKQPGKHLMESFEANIGVVLGEVRNIAGE